jgi:hypothetical protein
MVLLFFLFDILLVVQGFFCGTGSMGLASTTPCQAGYYCPAGSSRATQVDWYVCVGMGGGKRPRKQMLLFLK